MRVVTIPESCTRDEFMLCVRTALKTLVPFGKALVILDDDTIKYGDNEKDGTHCYKFFSDRWPAEQIARGQAADLIAIECPTHFSKESIASLMPILCVKENTILLVQERTKK